MEYISVNNNEFKIAKPIIAILMSSTISKYLCVNLNELIAFGTLIQSLTVKFRNELKFTLRP